MITEHIVQGNEQTTYHDFTFTQNGMNIMAKGTSYTQDGKVLYEPGGEVALSFSTVIEETQYEVWLSSTGLVIRSKTASQTFQDVPDGLDLLVWFTLPANALTLDSVNIHVKRMEAVA